MTAGVFDVSSPAVHSSINTHLLVSIGLIFIYSRVYSVCIAASEIAMKPKVYENSIAGFEL